MTGRRMGACWPSPSSSAYIGARSILVADADGRGLRRVGAGSNPDGRPTAAGSRSPGVASPTLVFRAPVSGGAPQRITAGCDPSWSPDGRRLVVSRGDGLYVVGANGTGARRIARGRVFSWQLVAGRKADRIHRECSTNGNMGRRARWLRSPPAFHQERSRPMVAGLTLDRRYRRSHTRRSAPRTSS